MQRWSVSDLPADQRSILTSLYGVQPTSDIGYAANQISYVRDLTENERWRFVSKSFMLPNFVVQTLYKVKGNLTPLRFNRAFRDMVTKLDILRSNYCSLGVRAVAVVFQERQELPRVIYQNMEGMDSEDLDMSIRKLMEADMREEMDLRHGNLIRFTVLHTGSEEYAVLVTMAQLIADRVDVMSILQRAMGREEFEEVSEASGDGVPQRESWNASMRDYWGKILSDLPRAPRIPFASEKTVKAKSGNVCSYRRSIPVDIVSDLRERAASNKMMLMAILQTAWGLLLQEYNDCRDVYSHLLVSGRKKQALGGDFRVMPVRLKNSDEITIRKLVAQQFQQIVVSQPYSCFDWDDLQEWTGVQGVRFHHYLSFIDFMTDEQRYSDTTATPEGTFVMQNSWYAHGTQLGIYFRYELGKVTFSFMYNKEYFIPEGARSLTERYLLILQQMITDWNLPVKSFVERFRQRIAQAKDGRACPPEDASVIQDVLSKLKLPQQMEEGIIQVLRKNAKLEIKFEGDRISGEDIQTKFLFVAKGKVARNIDLGDGWYNTMDILKDGDWINDTILLPEGKSTLSAEVLTEEAMIMTIALPTMQELMVKYPKLLLSMAKHLSKEVEKYRRLWMQA